MNSGVQYWTHIDMVKKRKYDCNGSEQKINTHQKLKYRIIKVVYYIFHCWPLIIISISLSFELLQNLICSLLVR